MNAPRLFALLTAAWSLNHSAPRMAAASSPPNDPEAGLPLVRAFSARETGVDTESWAAVQDARGTLTFGCNCLLSFDGERWRTRSLGPTYAIRGLDIGPDGRLWVAGANQIGWLDPDPVAGTGTGAYHSLVPLLPGGDAHFGEMWAAFARPGGGAVFVGQTSVVTWDGAHARIWPFPGSRRLFAARAAGEIYVDHLPTGLYRIGADGPVLVAPASAIGGSAVFWIHPEQGGLLLATNAGFMRLRDGACTAVPSEASAFIRANIPTCVTSLPDGGIAVGTLRNGVGIFDGAGASRIVLGTGEGLPSNQIFFLYPDRDGALWALTSSRIVRISLGSGVLAYDQRNGLPPGGCLRLAGLPGGVAVASDAEILRLRPGTGAVPYGRLEPLFQLPGRPHALLLLDDGELAAAGFHGILAWSGSEARPMYPSSEDVEALVQSASRPGTLLVSVGSRIVRIGIGNVHEPGTTLAADLPDSCSSLADEPDGTTWIGTLTKGLLVLPPGSPPGSAPEPAARRHGPVPDTGPAFVARAGGSLLAVAADSAWWLDAPARTLRPISGFPHGIPVALSNAGRAGTVWAALSAGPTFPLSFLVRLERGPDGRWQSRPVFIEGLPAAGPIRALRVEPGPDGDRLWIGGSEAVLRVEPRALSEARLPKRPSIRGSAEARGRTLPITDGSDLPFSVSRIHLEFASADYGSREQMRYETLLDGADRSWSPPTDQAVLDLANLRDGTYTLKVRLVTPSGTAGEEASLRFAIAPPWWRTAPGCLGLAAAAILAGLFAHRLRLRALRRRALELEETVRRRTAELEKANAAKTEFVASMSHEIRNPMNGVIGASLELADTGLDARQRDLVATIGNCARFLASLVEDVLDFAAIEAGSYEVERAPFSPAEALHSVGTMLRPRAAGVEIAAEVDPALPAHIIGDTGRIQQVIVNYVTNAIKFGGTRVRMEARADAGQVVFTVSDNGPGIPAAEQKDLFIRFSRLKAARNAAVPGTGLGLAVCRALADRMGGTVGVVSHPGSGARFFLRLPLMAAPDWDPSARPSESLSARALVVEDVDYNARALGSMLRKMGFQVDFASDGPGAVERFVAGDYNLVFLDCDLPGFSGLTAAGRMRSAEAPGRRALLIATTAYSTVKDRDACLAAGMDAFLGKPITPDRLKRVLAGNVGPTLPAAPVEMPVAESAPDELDIGMIRFLSDGSPESLDREINRFIEAVAAAAAKVSSAVAAGSARSVASAAHVLVGHARMVGDSALEVAAGELEDRALESTGPAELAHLVGSVLSRTEDLKERMARHRTGQLEHP